MSSSIPPGPPEAFTTQHGEPVPALAVPVLPRPLGWWARLAVVLVACLFAGAGGASVWWFLKQMPHSERQATDEDDDDEDDEDEEEDGDGK